jgi:hypothetical protein
MARYKMLVLSKPIEGNEAEYNDWYQNTHLKQVVALPGYISAQRFKRAVNMRGEDGYPYMALYEIEADDIDAAYKVLESAAGDGSIAVSQAFDYASVHASIYEPFGDVVNEAR